MNAWELIVTALVVAVLIGIGRVMEWHRVMIKDRYALVVIGAFVGLVYVVRAFLK